ncbi:unnamed protein product [Rhodiola kirilowii]
MIVCVQGQITQIQIRMRRPYQNVDALEVAEGAMQVADPATASVDEEFACLEEWSDLRQRMEVDLLNKITVLNVPTDQN